MWLILIQTLALGVAVSTVRGAELKCYIDITFLLDASGSIGSTDFTTQLKFVEGFAHDFIIGPQNVQIGVITFDRSVYNQFNLNTYTNAQAMINAINRIPYTGGSTNTADGLEYVRHHSLTRSAGHRDDAPSIVIVLTDGRSNDGIETMRAASRLNSLTVKVLAVGVGSGVDMAELRSIASTDKLVYSTASFNVLHIITGNLKSNACRTISHVQLLNNGTSPNGGGTGGGDGGGAGGVPMVNQGGVWAEICGDGVDVKDATVICRTLGYGSYLHHNRSSYLAEYSNFVDPGTINVVTDVLECTGNEDKIILCPLREQAGQHSCQKRVVVNCVPTLAEAVTSQCTSTHWNISIDMAVLNITYPGSLDTNIYLGHSSCVGTIHDGYRLVFTGDLLACGTHISYSDTTKIFSNQLVYAYHDPANPFIIRNYNWTLGVTCLLNRDQSGLTEVTTNQTHATNTTFTSETEFQLVTQFFTDPQFTHVISGSPLQMPVGKDVFLKVLVNNADWSVRMRLGSCYAQSSSDATSQKYYLIKNGCEVDVNTHIISSSAHETKFVFRMIQLGDAQSDVNVHCDAIFCTAASSACSHTCT